jgi:glutathione synthase/RimK-type ligase-like ATP-grasp enzyme
VIVLWGLPADPPLAEVAAALRALGEEPVLLDQRHTARGSGRLSVASELTASVEVAGRRLDLGRARAMYLRPYESPRLAAIRRAGPGSAAWVNAAEMDGILLTWAELTDAVVVNRPSAGAANGSKPFQARQLRELGFSVPQTLVTTDPEAVSEFRRRHQRVVYKSVSGRRSIVGELTDERTADLPRVRACPTQFQERVPGTDVRVHVVGDVVFTAEITCAATDYRYGERQGHPVTIRPGALPHAVEGRCRAAAAALGLDLAGFDLRRTPEDEYYCFEVNPSPAFSYYAAATGQAIATAVARRLLEA